VCEIISNDVNGLMASSKKELADCLLKVIAGEPLRKRLAKEGLARARAGFSMDRVTSRYLSIYLDATGRRLSA
jgi:glycosyltransferase involved in cell wall biosynthesis